MKIIGFGHRKRVGKDTAAKFLLSDLRMNHGKLRTARLSFGDQLKDMSQRMFGWGGLQSCSYYNNHPEEIEKILPALGKSPRNVWDEMGWMGREIHPKVWVEMAAAGIDCDLAISADIRFPTEVELIRKFGGLAIRIDRPDTPQVDTVVDTALAGFTGWDAVIVNDGNLKQFRQKILDICGPFACSIKL